MADSTDRDLPMQPGFYCKCGACSDTPHELQSHITAEHNKGNKDEHAGIGFVDEAGKGQMGFGPYLFKPGHDWRARLNGPTPPGRNGFCPNCGEKLDRRVGGRPRREIPVQQVLDVYERTGNVRETARQLDLPPGTVWHRLNEAGVLKKRSPHDRVSKSGAEVE